MRKTRIKPRSDKMRAQKIVEREIACDLFVEQNGKCAKCGCILSPHREPIEYKHEIIMRSHWRGGAIVKDNCQLLCGKCHIIGEHRTLSDGSVSV